MTPAHLIAASIGGGLFSLGFVLRARRVNRTILRAIGVAVIAASLAVPPDRRSRTPPNVAAVPPPVAPVPSKPDGGDERAQPMKEPHTMNAAATPDEVLDGWRERQPAPINPGDRS